MIDSHCHFDLPEFNGKHQQILERCAEVNVTKLLVPGLSVEQFSRLLKMASEFPCLDIALGCHPYFLSHLSDTELEIQINSLNDLGDSYQNSIVAIGECGLDGSLSLSMEYQQRVLEAQIHLAAQLQKPLILHHRQSHNELIQCLKRNNFAHGGVIHAFSGSLQTAETYIDMGFMLGVGGTITYPRARKTRHTIAHVPLQNLLLETDAPDMPIHGFQGQTNDPTKLPLIAQALAELKQVDIASIEIQTNSNYTKLFSR